MIHFEPPRCWAQLQPMTPESHRPDVATSSRHLRRGPNIPQPSSGRVEGLGLGEVETGSGLIYSHAVRSPAWNWPLICDLIIAVACTLFIAWAAIEPGPDRAGLAAASVRSGADHPSPPRGLSLAFGERLDAEGDEPEAGVAGSR